MFGSLVAITSRGPEADDPIFNWDTVRANSLCQDSSIRSEDIFANDYPDDNLSIETADLLANLNPEDDLSYETEIPLAYDQVEGNPLIETGDDGQYSAGGHSFETRDLSAGYYSEEDVFTDLLDVGSPVTNAKSFILSSNTEAGLKPRQDSYYPIPKFKLDPATDPSTYVEDAKAEDGTPIKPTRCPSKKRRACCSPNANPPFSQCWDPEVIRLAPGGTVWRQIRSLCWRAKSLFCCDRIIHTPGLSSAGGSGENCEDLQWSKDEVRAEQSPGDPSQSPSPIDLQELFPILKPLPKLPDPNPGYCPNPPL